MLLSKSRVQQKKMQKEKWSLFPSQSIKKSWQLQKLRVWREKILYNFGKVFLLLTLALLFSRIARIENLAKFVSPWQNTNRTVFFSTKLFKYWSLFFQRLGCQDQMWIAKSLHSKGKICFKSFEIPHSLFKDKKWANLIYLTFLTDSKPDLTSPMINHMTKK